MYRLFPTFFLFIFLVSGCGSKSNDKAKESQKKIPEPIGFISAEDNYASQIILTCYQSDMLGIDSLVNWIIKYRPGGLLFNDWPIEDIQMLDLRLDTLVDVKPLFFANYFKLIDKTAYPIWSANKSFQDSIYWKAFNYAGIDILQFTENAFSNVETVAYFEQLFDSQKLTPSYKINLKNKSIDDFELIAGAIQNSNGAIWFDSLKTDSLPYFKIKRNLNIKGLLIAHPIGNHLSHLEAGADMVVITNKSFFNPKYYNQNKHKILSYNKIRYLKGHSDSAQGNYSAKSFLKATKLHFETKSTILLNKSKNILPLKKYNTIALKNIIDQKLNKKKQLLIVPSDASDSALFKLSVIKNINTTLVVFSNPNQFDLLKQIPYLVFSNATGLALKSILNGEISISGDLISGVKKVRGHKMQGKGMINLPAEYAFVDSKRLNSIRAEIRSAIAGKAFPGCQVLGIKDNVLIYNKAFGHTTYQKNIPLNEKHIFDLASLTKVLSTTLVAMKLWEEGHFNLLDSIGDYLPDSLSKYFPNGSSIKNNTFQELFIHQSGLPAGFPVITYMRKAADENRYINGFCDYPYDNFQTEVAENLFLENTYQDSMWLTLNALWLNPNKTYEYSDVNMNTLYFLFKRIIEINKLAPEDLNNGNAFENYLYEKFYKPLGMISTKYKPLKRFTKNRIVPTENDRFWRKQLLQGHVHDPNAALYGGIAGNAGLFSNALDIGILLTMWQNEGVFEGKRYLKGETIRKFVSSQPNTHRGLGFNKRTFSNAAYAMAGSADQTSYGHTGFTGTCFWVDPVNKISYVFLSNRVHPSVSNKIYEFNIRRRVHQVFYDAILK